MINPAIDLEPNRISAQGGVNRLPAWFKQEIPDAAILQRMRRLCQLRINTVCQSAKCPNLSYCFKKAELTFMILGNTCTRHCRFCAVKKVNNESLGVDLAEPYRIAEMVKELGLSYAVITSVARDDLDDGGAGQFAKAIALIHSLNKNIKVEVLIPDFTGRDPSLQAVIAAGPEVIAHNIETVKRLYPELRPQADYKVSLEVLRKIKENKPDLTTKSSLLLGLGETEEEVVCAMRDLRESRCDILTLGQYLAPSGEHYPVKEFIGNEQFARYRKIALSLGFKAALSGPLVRSSYKAEGIYNKLRPGLYNKLRPGLELANNELKTVRPGLELANNELKTVRPGLGLANNELKTGS